jgi:hypothetical protein
MPAPCLAIEQDLAVADSGVGRQRILRRIRALAEVEHPNARTTAMRRLNLPFYADVDLIELTNPHWPQPAARLCFLEHAGVLHRLDGKPAPIHNVNKQADLRITAANVLAYLAFFCFFIRGDAGPFLVVDRLANRFLPRDVDRMALQRCFRPPRVIGQDHNGDWRASSLIYYAESLFFADFLVRLDGRVEMLDDWEIATHVGSQIDVPLSPSTARLPGR